MQRWRHLPRNRRRRRAQAWKRAAKAEGWTAEGDPRAEWICGRWSEAQRRRIRSEYSSGGERQGGGVASESVVVATAAAMRRREAMGSSRKINTSKIQKRKI